MSGATQTVRPSKFHENVRTMLRRRGYTDVKKEETKFVTKYQALVTTSLVFASAVDPERKEAVYCVHVLNKTRSWKVIEGVMESVHEFMAESTARLVVLLAIPFHVPKALCSGLFSRKEIFGQMNFAWDISSAVPRHEKLIKEEFMSVAHGERLPADDIRRMDITKLPKMLVTDAQARYWDFRKNDLIKVHSVPLTFLIVQ